MLDALWIYSILRTYKLLMLPLVALQGEEKCMLC
jgi:hypothetical protein